MPNKLQLQTVYVPVEGDLNDRPVLCIWRDDGEGNDGWDYQTDLDKQENRIVLTPQELVLLLAEYKEGPLGLTEFCNHKKIPI